MGATGPRARRASGHRPEEDKADFYLPRALGGDAEGHFQLDQAVFFGASFALLGLLAARENLFSGGPGWFVMDLLPGPGNNVVPNGKKGIRPVKLESVDR